MMSVIASLEAEYGRYKTLAEAAIAQLSDDELTQAGPGGSNSIDMLVRHVAGNLQSRFSDFRTSDGEKPWRHRDDEFEPAAVSRNQLMEMWERAWKVLFGAVSELRDPDLAQTVTIRSTKRCTGPWRTRRITSARSSILPRRSAARRRGAV
jgi:hypothetical protein